MTHLAEAGAHSPGIPARARCPVVALCEAIRASKAGCWLDLATWKRVLASQRAVTVHACICIFESWCHAHACTCEPLSSAHACTCEPLRSAHACIIPYVSHCALRMCVHTVKHSVSVLCGRHVCVAPPNHPIPPPCFCAQAANQRTQLTATQHTLFVVRLQLYGSVVDPYPYPPTPPYPCDVHGGSLHEYIIH